MIKIYLSSVCTFKLGMMFLDSSQYHILYLIYFFFIIILFPELSDALNVSVTPGPVSMCMEGDNITLSCLVSQRKRSSSVLVLRWLYFPTPEDENLVVRMGMKKAKYYGNYSKHFPQTKFHLWEEMDGQIYRLLILNVSLKDGGNYTCKVQEIRKHRNKWRASSNGTGSMELRGNLRIFDVKMM